MDFAAVTYYLNDLPRAFKRPGTTFAWWQNSLAYGLSRYTEGSDGILSQVSYADAQWGWLDAWGQLYSTPRPAGASDPVYRNIINFLLTSRGATPVSIQDYMMTLYGISSSIQENFSTVSWNLRLNSPLVSSGYDALAQSLGEIRPAGVPFTPFYISAGGNFLSTVNFLGKSRVPGSWLTTSTLAQTFSLNAGTPNIPPNLPITYLIDPTINPALSTTPIPAPLAILSNPNSVPPAQSSFGSDAYTNFTIVSQDPNLALAGGTGDKAFNISNRILYICTFGGTISTALWTPVDEVVGSLP